MAVCFSHGHGSRAVCVCVCACVFLLFCSSRVRRFACGLLCRCFSCAVVRAEWWGWPLNAFFTRTFVLDFKGLHNPQPPPWSIGLRKLGRCIALVSCQLGCVDNQFRLVDMKAFGGACNQHVYLLTKLWVCIVLVGRPFCRPPLKDNEIPGSPCKALLVFLPNATQQEER